MLKSYKWMVGWMGWKSLLGKSLLAPFLRAPLCGANKENISVWVRNLFMLKTPLLRTPLCFPNNQAFVIALNGEI